MKCPCCAASLETLEYEGVSIMTCPGCNGEFIAPDELAHVVTTRSERFQPSTLRAVSDRAPVFGVPAEEQARQLDCPACGDSMRVLNYATDTGICVDRCDGCGGIWLDDQELEKVQALLEDWADRARDQIALIAPRLDDARRSSNSPGGGAFDGSRFAFVNAVINRILDSAA
ncbi:MAG: TFIIB-type zinc ribbon-containing protein [Planctomycetota bacterium]|jgi:Zn-finger nucleic acid-binding protein